MPIVTCGCCGSPVKKTRSVINQQIKRGAKNFFCNQSCSSSFNMKVRHAEWRKTHQKKTYQKVKKQDKKLLVIASIAGRIAGRSREAGIPCELNTKMLRRLLDKQKGLCAYSGEPMKMGGSRRGNIEPEQLSVDRINAAGGYTEQNVVLCCYWINAAKMRMPLSIFRDRVIKLGIKMAALT